MGNFFVLFFFFLREYCFALVAVPMAVILLSTNLTMLVCILVHHLVAHTESS